MKFSNTLLRSAQIIKPHVPLIKFRRTQVQQHVTAKPTVSKGAESSSSGGHILIDERHLPSRFRRQLLDEKEISAINSGGAL